MVSQAALIGEMRHRVTVQQVSHSTDSQGGQVESWADLVTIWAKFEAASVAGSGTGERRFADRIEYQRTHKATIRYNSQITTDMRISFDSRTFQIKGIRRLDERRFFMVLDLAENVGT